MLHGALSRHQRAPALTEVRVAPPPLVTNHRQHQLKRNGARMRSGHAGAVADALLVCTEEETDRPPEDTERPQTVAGVGLYDEYTPWRREARTTSRRAVVPLITCTRRKERPTHTARPAAWTALRRPPRHECSYTRRTGADLAPVLATLDPHTTTARSLIVASPLRYGTSTHAHMHDACTHHAHISIHALSGSVPRAGVGSEQLTGGRLYGRRRGPGRVVASHGIWGPPVTRPHPEINSTATAKRNRRQRPAIAGAYDSEISNTPEVRYAGGFYDLKV